MNILQVHNYYQLKGGEDAVLDNEKSMLESKGHTVKRYTVKNSGITSVVDKLNVLCLMRESKKHAAKLQSILKIYRPDIVHIHNVYPLLTPAIFSSVKKLNIPVIQTLHNFRMICVNGLFYQKGKVCKKCLTGSRLSAITGKCYQNSHVASIAMADSLSYHNRINTWNKDVDGYIVLTNFAKNILTKYGIDKSKLFLKPNYLPDEGDGFIEQSSSTFKVPKKFAMFVGRLSEEKGIKWLVKSWKDIDYPLVVAGDGPLMNQLKEEENKNVIFVGMLGKLQLRKLYKTSSMLIMSSEWYEGFPMVILEAYMNAVPVLVPNIGGLPDIVQDSISGYVYELNNAEQFRLKVKTIFDNNKLQATLAKNAKNIFMKNYTEDVNYKQLMNIYKTIINRV